MVSAKLFAQSRFGATAMGRLRLAFDRSRHPMLISDDQRRWVTGNASACELLGLQFEEIPWCAMDDFTSPEEHGRLGERWEEFLTGGAAEGWYSLYVPERGAMPVEFSAIANILPARHLAVFIPPDATVVEYAEAVLAREAAWAAVRLDGGRGGRRAVESVTLTEREREILTLVAVGMQGPEIAESLFLSTETVKSHVQSAMTKLGARTRAHAVAIALLTGQINSEVWEL